MTERRRRKPRPRRRRLVLWGVLLLLLIVPAGDTLRWRRAEVRPTPDAGAPPAVRPDRPATDGVAPAPGREDLRAADAWFGRAAEIELLVREGQWSAAANALDQFEPRPGAAAALRHAELSSALTRGLDELQADLRADAAAGAVPRLVARLRAAASPAPHPRLSAALDAWFRVRGWPPLLALPSVATVVAEPDNLPKGLPVVAQVDGAELRGSVAACSEREVTLAVTTADGVLFPTVPRTAVVPVDLAWASAQARAALRSGDLLLAAAWLVSEVERGNQPQADLSAVLARWRK